jgi:hypothetical protein
MRIVILFHFTSDDLCTIFYGVLWKRRKERVEGGRGRKYGDEPSTASEKWVCVIVDILEKYYYLLFLL